LVLGTSSLCGWLKPKVRPSALALTYVVSVISRLLFLSSCSVFSFSDLVLQLSLLLKLGLPPFQFWVFKVLPSLSLTDLCFFVGPLKSGLLWLLVCSSSTALFLVSVSLIIGILLLWNTSTIQLLLFGSGLCQTFIFVILGPRIFPLYFSIYLLALFGVSVSQSSLLSPFLAFLRLGSLPPFSIFWAKVLAISCLPNIFVTLVLLVSILTLWPYVRFSISSSFSYCSPSSPPFVSLLILLPFYGVLLLS